MSSPLNNSDSVSRPIANFSPSIWGCYFLNFSSPLTVEQLEIKKQLQHLKDQVRELLLLEDDEDPIQKLNLIDNIHRLGVSYLFESEIEEILQVMHKNPPPYDSKDLHTISLWFRLLRQQGYNPTSGIFNQFKDENGEFKMSLIEDVMGLLSLYEAAYFGIHGEDVLDEAIKFTTYHLESRLSGMSSNLRKRVANALNCPIRKGIPRLEARYYIPLCSEDASINDPLLELATLDFNFVQALHRVELSHVTEWWKKLDFVTKVPYARDRVVEVYFWSLSVHFEPQYTIGRKIVCKLIGILSAIDDTYDAYETLQELEVFTEAFQRWDASPMDHLPQGMKVIFQATLGLFDEMELLTAEKGTSCFVQYVKRAFQKLVKSYLIEAKWCNQGYIPTYEEYIEIGIVTSGHPLLQITSLLGIGNHATKDLFDWISNDPKIVRASAIIGRVENDMSSHKFEQERVHTATAVECVMNQHGISEEEAYKHLKRVIENSWKDLNEECQKLSNVIPKAVVDLMVNYSSIIELTYANFADRYTTSGLLKDHIAALVVDPVGN